jgi:hypothetical protein
MFGVAVKPTAPNFLFRAFFDFRKSRVHSEFLLVLSRKNMTNCTENMVSGDRDARGHC